jgi:hypothetical protein
LFKEKIEEEGEILASSSLVICLSYSPLIVKCLLHSGDMEILFRLPVISEWNRVNNPDVTKV